MRPHDVGGRGGGRGRGDGWIAGVALAVLVAAPVGATVAVSVARSPAAARGGDTDDGIGFVVPALLGAAGAALLVLTVAVVVLAVRGGRAERLRFARGVVVVPVLAALPVLALLLGGSLLAAVVAVLPVVITGTAAVAVWRSPRVGLAVLGVFVVIGVAVVAVLGPDAVVLLLPHLLLGVGCWLIAAVLLAPEVQHVA